MLVSNNPFAAAKGMRTDEFRNNGKGNSSSARGGLCPPRMLALA